MKLIKVLPLILCLFFVGTTPISFSEGVDELEGIAFSIPANSFCDRSHEIQLSINLTNLNSKDSLIKLNLYDKQGNPIDVVDQEYNGIRSDIQLGTNKSVPPAYTTFYQVNFGGNNNSCDYVPYYGVIEGDSGETRQIIASGWITATNGNTPVIINSGNAFSLGGGSESPEEPIEDPVPNGSKEVCEADSDIVVSASSEYSKNFAPCYAFDGDAFSSWATKVNTTSGWLKIDFSNAYAINEYSISARTKNVDGVGTNPKNWTLEASNDDQTWTVINTQTNQTNWDYGEKRVFSVDNNEKYRYYRLNISENNGVAFYTAIGEISFKRND